MDHLKLEIKPHHHPYDIGWIKQVPCIKVMDLCQVLNFIGKHYQDFVTCDVDDMDKCHILLERQWQHDVDATHRGGEDNMCLLGRVRELP